MVLPSHMAVTVHSAMVSGLRARRSRRRGGVCPAQPPPVGERIAPRAAWTGPLVRAVPDRGRIARGCRHPDAQHAL